MDQRSQTAWAWVPNAITLSRCILAAAVGVWIWMSAPVSLWPFAAFVLLALTDFLDGWAARRIGAITPFGTFLDPVADKLLVAFALIALSALQNGAAFLVIPTVAVIARDLIATALRLVPSINMPVSRLAKWKTAFEMGGIAIMLLALPTNLTSLWGAGVMVIWAAAALSVYTLGLYVGAALADVKRPRE